MNNSLRFSQDIETSSTMTRQQILIKNKLVISQTNGRFLSILDLHVRRMVLELGIFKNGFITLRIIFQHNYTILITKSPNLQTYDSTESQRRPCHSIKTIQELRKECVNSQA